MFLEAGGGAARRAQPAAAGFACGFALRAKSGAAVVGRWQWATAGGDGSGLPRAGTAAGCRGRTAAGCRGRTAAGCGGRTAAGCRGRTAAGCRGRTAGRPCGEAAHRPRRRRGRAPPRRACRPYCCGAQRPARKKTRPGKPQFSGPGLVLIDSPCARSGGVFPPGSGQGRWYRRGSW